MVRSENVENAPLESHNVLDVQVRKKKVSHNWIQPIVWDSATDHEDLSMVGPHLEHLSELEGKHQIVQDRVKELRKMRDRLRGKLEKIRECNAREYGIYERYKKKMNGE